jgi:hypothetical protein
VQFIDGFGPAIAVSAGLSAVGALAGLALPGRRAASGPSLVTAPALETEGVS